MCGDAGCRWHRYMLAPQFPDDISGAHFGLLIDSSQVFPDNAYRDQLHTAEKQDRYDKGGEAWNVLRAVAKDSKISNASHEIDSRGYGRPHCRKQACHEDQAQRCRGEIENTIQGEFKEFTE